MFQARTKCVFVNQIVFVSGSASPGDQFTEQTEEAYSR